MIRELAVVLVAALPALAAPPPTPTKPVTDTYHDRQVIDDYRWLENWGDPAVQAWSEAQNAHARGVLDALPGRDAIRQKVSRFMLTESVSYSSIHSAKGLVFAMKRQPPRQQPFLVVMNTGEDPSHARVLLDPARIDQDGGATIDWFVPSPDGKLIAASISHAGSEMGDVSVFDTATGKPVFETVRRVQGGTAGGSLAWSPTSDGFFYTRYPREGERPKQDLDFYVQVYFHALGRPDTQDTYEVGKEFPRIAEVLLESDPENGWVLASVQNGDGGEYMHFLRVQTELGAPLRGEAGANHGAWMQVTKFDDRIVQANLAPGGDLLLISRKHDRKGELKRLSRQHLLSESGVVDLRAATSVVPPTNDTLVSSFFDDPSLLVTKNSLVLTYQLGGPSELRVFDHSGKPLGKPPLPPVSGVSALTRADDADGVLFAAATYTTPASFFAFDATKPGESRESPFSSVVPPEATIDPAQYVVTREFAASKDGTKIPINIIHRKGIALDGNNPCLVTGYGGYGVSIEPRLRDAWKNRLEHGFVIAEANIRGGGEFGDDWHLQGNLTRKQNVFDDFAAACRLLIERKYTNSARLAIEGGSNGGLLMGATFTQHPNLAACVVSHVGIYDMLRVEQSANGTFNITEFGTVQALPQFRALHAYSPYHNVKNGTRYPAVLFMTGANDPRVDPMQSRKMTARLQASCPECTTLLRTSSTSGHGMGTKLSERVEQVVDADAFLFSTLRVEVSP